MKTQKLFCANEQIDTPHTVDIDQNGEYLFTCECGRFIKFPEDVKIKEVLSAHKEANMGQISVEAVEKNKAEKLKALDDLEEEVEE